MTKIWTRDINDYVPGSANNFLINGGFEFAQRQAPATLTTITSGAYGPDRWRIQGENASIQYVRGAGPSTIDYGGGVKKITNAGKAMIYQILEGVDTAKLSSGDILGSAAFSLAAQSAQSVPLKFGLIAWTGTKDAVSASIISAWGANGANPTLAANLAYIGTPGSLSTNISWVISNGGDGMSGSIPFGTTNLIAAVWTDSQMNVNDSFYISQAAVYTGTYCPMWRPTRTVAQELMLCQRFYEKGYEIDTPPGYNFGVGAGYTIFYTNSLYYSAVATSTNRRYTALMPFKVQKRISPTSASYWDLVGNVSKCSTGNADGTWVANDITETYQGLTWSSYGVAFQTATSCYTFSVCWAVDAEL